MGGLAGFMGTYIIGPREGLFKRDEKLAYILDDHFLDEEDSSDNDIDRSYENTHLRRNKKKKARRDETSLDHHNASNFQGNNHRKYQQSDNQSQMKENSYSFR